MPACCACSSCRQFQRRSALRGFPSSPDMTIHLLQVGWANASLRHLQQLPVIPEAPGTGVFREDPLTTGMAPDVRALLDQAALEQHRNGAPAACILEQRASVLLDTGSPGFMSSRRQLKVV